MIRFVFAILVVFTAWSVTVVAADMSEAQRAAIQERIKPVGESCMVGDSDCGGGASAAASGGVARSGEDVYGAACMACHSTGAGGAPKVGDAVAWADRIAQGMDVLHDHGINGIAGTSMMAKGGCMSCSDVEVMAAVVYMVEGSQ